MNRPYEPLASRLRPRTLEEFIGQEHLLARNRPLRSSLETGQIYSLIFWGPPGVGKTTLARLIATKIDALFLSLSAVMAGVKDIRAAVDRARDEAEVNGRKTVLFLDEVHRFNKSQQDAFLPYIEDGTLIFIGATTENPSFELNNALLSRCKVFVLKSLDTTQIATILLHALHSESGLANRLHLSESQIELIAQAADGDARRALTLLEMLSDLTDAAGNLTDEQILQVVGDGVRRFDKRGEIFYDQISALHKAVRGSAPDAALYWFGRMIDGGCDPLYIARRLVRMASEDIGLADPRALQMALNGWDVYERLGSPEGELTLAQVVLYLAVAPKSNASYMAWNRVMTEVKGGAGTQEVPMHLRNAPTKLMKQLDYGKGYRYAHDESNRYAAGENYFPDGYTPPTFYEPVDQGLEIRIREKLDRLKQLVEKSRLSQKNKGTSL